VQLQSYTYDDANQVSGWAYDATGNLLIDDTTEYTYDALNRQLSTTQDGQTRTNSYNGDGVLVAQELDSIVTPYTQDLVAPLSQILNDGTVQYVYGNERLFGTDAIERTWYSGDALGSVRQTFDDAGLVQQAVSYDAWGVPHRTLWLHR
jgi:hypothetical protein